eukprot:CAMPEP_0115644934 /NCGR_PEP_ID=MMETSP0272-20121206/38142_1 /TAXON_ID=71861 /ORGANISM="Scrippsiella trochoidea, Strain CCMP3099" /LENGTH=83 /DNA_ID=CAMNT_0003082389 /DNA_START=717 /DNA_END=969 /DNA_ORIENTATION=-
MSNSGQRQRHPNKGEHCKCMSVPADQIQDGEVWVCARLSAAQLRHVHRGRMGLPEETEDRNRNSNAKHLASNASQCAGGEGSV